MFRTDPETPDLFITPVDEVFIRNHLGPLPRLDRATWSLTVEGLVERPLRLDFPDIQGLPQTRLTAVHECFGNPLRPDVPTRAVTNLEWAGVPLAAVLELAGPRPEARHVWLEGADTGDFAGESGLSYLKDLPLDQASAEVVLAHTMNGEPLRPDHGYPLRAVAPLMFGTNSVKWLSRIVLAADRPDHLFTTRLYTRVPPGGREAVPVREKDVSSKLLTPGDGSSVPAGSCALAGYAWSSTEVTSVEIAVDDADWQPAALDRRGPDPAWQRFRLRYDLAPGPHRIRCRATDSAGRVQPLTGDRNAVHEIRVVAGAGSPPAGRA
ncbi:molybdopterin-dependent oxidoreductase [Streptomyces novaecaesareae]|uniref:molybdopterin-dependent oxidoreductase n=1 Tax=Streptomyces novaecaesareae TaxID=68244 RepID=UPI00068B9771|nr:molybdopterin-dependent oxidoreductase [Streptomyces novaecaesareae]